MQVFTLSIYKTFFAILFLVVSISSNGQAVGDYRSSGTNGNWTNLGTWERCNSITPVTWATPTAAQGYPGQYTGTGVVTILSSHNVTLNVSPSNVISSLEVLGGTLGFGDNTARTLRVAGNVSVTSTGTITILDFNDTHTFFIGGNLTNNGVFDMRTAGNDLCNVTFNGTANQTVSGTGSTTDFNLITINNTGATNNNIVEIMPTNFTTVAGFLTLTDGIIKMSGTYNLTNTFFATANYIVPAIAGIWLNNNNVTVTAQNNNINLRGLLRITAGIYNVGTGTTHKLLYYTGSTITIEGGSLNVAAALGGSSTTDQTTYTQTGGTVTVATAGVTQNWASFEIWDPGTIFSMSGGTIVLQRLNSNLTDFINNSINSTVTGGTLQVGNINTQIGDFFWISSVPPVYDLVISPTNNPRGELRLNTIVLNDVTINTGSELDASVTQNVSLSVGRNFINNGTFTPQNGTVAFNGNGLQSISGTTNTTFYNLTANNTAGITTTGITLNRPASVNNVLTLTNGHITTTSNLLTMNAGSSVAGANYGTRASGGSDNSFVNGPLRKNGNTAFLFPVGKLNAGHRYIGISAPSTGDAFIAEFLRASANALGTVTATGLSHVSACENWNLQRTVGSTNVNVTLSWSGSSNCNAAAYVTDLATLVAAHFTTSWSSYNNNGGNTGNVSSGSVTWNGVPAYGFFSLGSTSPVTNPLPVKFSSVKAYAAGLENIIEWVNETEESLERYEVERSADGIHFSTIHSVLPRLNTGSRAAYFETDRTVNQQTFYYRIKAIEKNELIKYSAIVKVNRSQADNFSIYPNPVKNKTVVIELNSANKENYSVRIINQAGQQVYLTNWQHTGGNASRTIELPASIIPGIYIVHITGTGKNLNTKLIVQ